MYTYVRTLELRSASGICIFWYVYICKCTVCIMVISIVLTFKGSARVLFCTLRLCLPLGLLEAVVPKEAHLRRRKDICDSILADIHVVFPSKSVLNTCRLMYMHACYQERMSRRRRLGSSCAPDVTCTLHIYRSYVHT